MNAENSVHPAKTSSPFFSMFHKKRQPSAPPTATIEEFDAYPAPPRNSMPPLPPRNGISTTIATLPPTSKGSISTNGAEALKRKGSAPAGKTAPTEKLSFAQRVKLHKGVRTGKLPFTDLLKLSHSQQNLPPKEEKHKKEALKRNKAFSADAINELDPVYLTEALLAIGDEQPIVARSIPKHAATNVFDDKRKNEERRRRNCLYDPEVYDRMLSDSLQVCDLLQSHLNECIVTVRAKSPTPKPTSPTPYYYSPTPATRGLPPTGRSMTSVPASPVAPYRSSVSVSSSAMTRKAESLEPPATSSTVRIGYDIEPRGSAQGSLSPSVLSKKAHKKLQFADQ